MNNISLSGEDLILKSNVEYIAIDSLYVREIKKELDKLEHVSLASEIREKIFPFPNIDIPFAEFILEDGVFRVNSIVKADYQTIDLSNKEQHFAADTGLLLMIPLNLVKKFSTLFDYDELVDGPLDEININYWKNITSKFESDAIGLIVAPGIDSGFEFEGGGVYNIG